LPQLSKVSMSDDLSSLSAEIQELFSQQKILIVDKPTGMTSHDVVNRMRRETGVKRIGHAGTLDPLATGILIILIGREATRLQDQLMHMEKEYVFTAELGWETDTYDSQGKTVQEWSWEEVQKITKAKLENVIQKFIGEYDQQVPAYSAVKQSGRKLYELARKQEKIELPTRKVRIQSIELEKFDRDEVTQTTSFMCRVVCGTGTYIRSLAVDIGRALAVGATVTALRRTKVGPFSL
jgi:tRNA pseudouridine55 synthase